MTEPFADAIVVAAGASSRMGGADKLLADVGGRPLLAWSVEAMAAAQSVRRVIVVAAPAQVGVLTEADWLHAIDATVVGGGQTRSQSVLAGLNASAADVVLVHDGARPLVTPALADAVAHAAVQHGAAIPAVPLSDSLKSTDGEAVLGSVERGGLALAQTPQAARRRLLLDAFAAAGDRSFTDEAGLLEAHGVRVVTVPGEVGNIKVTRVDDLEVVRAMAAVRSGSTLAQTGFGRDNHQFGRGDGLWLGGVLISDAPRLHGHSDGDVALHALSTALLSAAGMGDVGRLFPATDAATAGAPSSKLLRETVAQLAAAGWRPASASIALLGARPRLGGRRLDEMREVIAGLLGLAVDGVAVTASTGNLSGDEGSGRAISATALVSVARA